MNRAVIIGAGPAGLTAALELLRSGKQYEVIILEESGEIGGISRTVQYRENGWISAGTGSFRRMSG